MLGFLGILRVAGRQWLRRWAAAMLAPLATAALASPLPIEVLVVRQQPSYEIEIAHSATVVARREATLGFERGGRIWRMQADLGTAVEQGAVLASLDCEQERLARSLGEAQLAEASAGAELAAAQHRRAEQLAQEGLLGESNLDISGAELQVARARRASSQANLERLRDTEGRCQLRAPWAGAVSRRFLSEGDIVGPGTPVFAFVELAQPEVRVQVPLDFSRDLQLDEALQVRSKRGLHEARLLRLGPVTTESRQTRELRLRLEEPDGLLVGDAVEVLQPSRRQERGFWVPTSALRSGVEGLWSLMLVTDAPDGLGKVSPVPVEILYVHDGRAYVRGQVHSGEQVVARGGSLVAPGQLVSPVPFEGPLVGSEP